MSSIRKNNTSITRRMITFVERDSISPIAKWWRGPRKRVHRRSQSSALSIASNEINEKNKVPFAVNHAVS
jgi:hypothetical protein